MTDPFLAELRTEVVAAARRQDRRRRRHRTGGLAAAAVVIALLTSGVLLFDAASDADARVEVVEIDGELRVRITDIEARPHEIETAAADAGLDLEIEPVPVGPSNVGRFVGAYGSEGLPPDLRRTDGDGATSFDGFLIPAGFDGQLRLSLGRPAEPGEEWTVGSNALSRGELLACEPLQDAPLSDTLAAIDALDTQTEVRIYAIDANIDLTPEQHHEWSDATVTGILSASPTLLFVDVAYDPALIPTRDESIGC